MTTNIINTENFSFDEDERAITAYFGKNVNVKIPETINNIPVKKIAAKAFIDENIESLKMNDNVELIKEYSFADCNIKKLIFGHGLIKIGKGAFENNSLTDLVFPYGLEEISDNAFYNNYIKEVDFNDGLEQIGQGAFQKNNIKLLDLPDRLGVLQDWAFAENQITTIIDIGGVKELRDCSLFNNLIQDTSFLKYVSYVDEGALQKNNIQTLTIEDLKGIESNAFKGNPVSTIIAGPDIKMKGDIINTANPKSFTKTYHKNNQKKGVYVLRDSGWMFSG